MATQEEKELRQKVLDDIKRKRAAAAQAEGSVRAAEEGQYGDVGQGEKGPFDDIIDQTAEMVTTPQTGIGALMTLLGQGNIFLADKRVPFSNLFTEGGMDFTDAMKLISQGPDDRVYTKKDLGKKIGYGNVVTEEMLGQKKPLTLADISQNIGKFLFEGPAKQMERARDEGVGYFDMKPMERFEVASGPLTEIIPGVGFAPDIIKGGIQIARPAGQSILKSIDELTAPVNQMQTAGGPNINMMENLSEAPIIQVSKTSTKVDPTAPGRSKLGTIKYGDKEMVKDQVSRYNEALEKINNLKETVFNVTADSSPEAIEAAGKAYKEIVEGSDDVLKIALGNNIKTSGYKSQGSIIQDASGINKKEFLDFKNKHPLRSGNSLNKALRLNSAAQLLENYRAANPDSLGIEINFRKLKEILGESEEFKNIFADIPVEVLDARKFSQTKNLTREEKYIESILNNYQADFVTIEKYLSDLGFPLARPFKYRKTDKVGAAGKRLVLELNEQQQNIFQNKRTEIQNALKEIQTIPIGKDGMKGSEKVKDFLKTTTERMKGQGASEAEIIKAVENINADELAGLILKREEANLLKLNNLQEYDEISKVFGGNPPEESLFTYQIGHIKALEDSIESSLDMNNLMIQTQYSNQLDNQVRNYVKTKIKQFNELPIDDPKSSALRQRLIDDLDQIDEIAREEGVFTMIEGRKFGDETKAVVKESDFPKDEAFSMNMGGLATMDHMTRPLV